MTQNSSPIKVALVDDHQLLRNALAGFIDNFANCKVTLQMNNGQELIDQLPGSLLPDIIILDLNMPVKNGQETAEWLYKNYPDIPILMLTMFDSELTMIRLLQNGIKGFLRKDVHPTELKFALNSVITSGFYYSNHTTGKLVNLFRNGHSGSTNLQKSMLSDQEVIFLQLVCSDMTYKEVAQKMGLNPRSIDSLRDQLFLKLDVRSRVGLAMVSIKNGIFSL